MMEQEVYKELNKKAPSGYRLNELVPFSYPVRKIRLEVLLNKNPDNTLIKVYSILLRAIEAGFDKKENLFEFLGFSQSDEFMERELFYLREKGLIDLVSERWYVTTLGEQFITDHSVLRVEEKEDFEFLLDGISGKPISFKDYRSDQNSKGVELPMQLIQPPKSPELLDALNDDIANLIKHESQNKIYLINYQEDGIKLDLNQWIQCWLIEYTPIHNKELESKLEVRTYEKREIIHFLSERFNTEYKYYLNLIAGNEREDIAEIILPISTPSSTPKAEYEQRTLSIWETKAQFIEALKSVKTRILIESPWIKQATQEYLPIFEKILSEGKQLIILYGIGEKDDHHYSTVKALETLQVKHPKTFRLIHLPSHFQQRRSKLTGTHRKLVIKDEDYYLSGSFNFLSFGKQEHQKVANEESNLFTQGVKQKWENVLKDYGLSI